MPRFVMSFIRPDRTAVLVEADPFTTTGSAIKTALWAFSYARVGATLGDARWVGRAVMDAPGTEITHEASGLIFRIDPADNPPNVCPCCLALVRPGDHAFAGQEDAYCLGCFTWDRNTPQCLPANTAHPEGYDPDKET